MMLPLPVAWFINVPVLALTAVVVWRGAARGMAAARWFWPVLAARLAAGVAYGTHFFTGADTFGLHRESVGLARWAVDNPAAYGYLLLTPSLPVGAPPSLYTSFSNSFFFIRAESLLNFLTGGSYWLNGSWLSLAAFAGSWLLARELARVVPQARWGAWVGALAWPSVVFWTSGVSKDALLMAALGLTVAAALRLIYPPAGQRPARWWAALLLGGWLFWKIKFFIAAVLLVVLAALAGAEWLAPPLRARRPGLRTWHLLVGLALVLAPLSRVAHRAFRPKFLLTQVARNQAALRPADSAQPALRLPLQSSLASLATYAPAAAVGVFVRPWPWEGSGLRWRVVGLENAALLVLFVGAAWRWWRRGHSVRLPPLAAALLLVVAVVAVLFGLTTPNLGTLHRYRAVLLPFALFLLEWWRVGERTDAAGGSESQSAAIG